jgi:signal transduction histidine kinase
VKGLAALLGQQLPEGKGAERLAVLRGEVDRMQVVLEEFLNFSRPLAPLTVEPVRLRALCAEVVALHEGVARARGVPLELEGDEAEVRCDARKVRQVLINLVQNALDASPRGSSVALRCEAGPAGATLRVEDRGPGLEPAILRRLFEPGATTKPQGNGLGLTVARSLARQHGGELVLGPREGGGCAAVVTLPLAPAAARGDP